MFCLFYTLRDNTYDCIISYYINLIISVNIVDIYYTSSMVSTGNLRINRSFLTSGAQ